MKYFIQEFKEGMRYFGDSISFLVNVFLFSIVYLIGIGITSIFMKISRKHLLEIKNSKKDSYWKDLNLKGDIDNYYNQF
ncbi:MAG: hypothetical protein ACD_11C00018G0033 [uncultured bacterium]|nr:MAG: hypothetical protein ACD_11C00018G0033 [uncultured bacterium]HBR71559.1 hypothetical protein [Candidatus Moranbacteria bacterium]